MNIAVAVVPVQIAFQRGRNSIELQATIATAPRAEPVPLEIEPTECVEETRPVLHQAFAVVVEKQINDRLDPEKPQATEPETKPTTTTEVLLAERDLPPVEADKPPPPPRKQAEAQPNMMDAPTVSVAQSASQAKNGVEFDVPPEPHPYNRKPPYPVASRELREEGRVWLRVQITIQGTVDVVEVMRSSGHVRLDDAAVATVRDWRFTPARRGGGAVTATFNLPILFRL